VSKLTPRTSAWQQSGELATIAGHRIFVREQPASGQGRPLLFLHGYPSSSYDWRHAFQLLGGHRLIVFDFLGYGLSDKPRDQVYSLQLQADIAEALAARFDEQPVTLISHDMGSSVATEILARDLEGRLSFHLGSALVFNGSLVRERASLLRVQKLLLSRLGPLATRLTNESAFRRQFASIFSADHPVSAEEVADQWSLLTHNHGQRLLHRLIYYNKERVTLPGARWHAALRDWPGILEFAWAESDPICTEAVLQALLQLRPHAERSRLHRLGHYPQIEDPEAAYRIIQRHSAQV
jgi:pimeloyl-ACP methyl ester carboxylesterase